MRHTIRRLTMAVSLGVLASVCAAQSPKDQPSDAPKSGLANASVVDSIVARMMAFDKNKDGKLTRDEITDERLLRLFERADANKDGTVTKEELNVLATQMAIQAAAAGGPRGGFGGPGGFGPGGQGGRGPGGFGGPPQPGQILPRFLQERLSLTAEQKQQLEELQKGVDARLAKLFTDDQKAQLQGMRQRGPGRFGPPGPGGPGGPGGPAGPGGFGPGGPGGGGPGGPGGFATGGPGDRGAGGPPPPGQILPSFVQERLNLTAEQKQQVEELQKGVDTRLAKLLTDAQKTQLQEMRQRGPGGFGRPGGQGPSRGPERPE